MTYILLVILAVLQYFDYKTTMKILSQGGRELNPILNFLNRFVSMKTLLIVKGAVVVAGGMFIAYANHNPMSMLALAALCLWYGWVVNHNSKAIK